MATPAYAGVTVVPRGAVRLPLPLPIPDGFEAERPETWPAVEGTLEYVEGRLEYMPPCGETQQRVVAAAVGLLWRWREGHPDFAIGTNEAGMMLGGDVRGADVAVWRTAKPSAGFARTPPILAIEVLGKDETLDMLQSKSAWYLAHGVDVVWIVAPDAQVVQVATQAGTTEVTDRIPEHPSLPGLSLHVADLFGQL